jgi:hypothetical protein
MTNRHTRRAAAARARKRQTDLYHDYIRHLPRVPVGASLERGRVYHLVLHHDDRCKFYETENVADCNCDVVVSQHIEPRRS